MSSPFTSCLIYYRLSSKGYAKAKPAYASKQACLTSLLNAIAQFKRVRPSTKVELHIQCDGCTAELETVARAALMAASPHVDKSVLEASALGSGAASFRHVLNYALAQAEAREDAATTSVYMIEDDYLHVPHALLAMHDALLLAPYVTGYDHPDKYAGSAAPNPLLKQGGEFTLVVRTPSQHWKRTNSTTMTFLAQLTTLAVDAPTILPLVSGSHPHDFGMWQSLSALKDRWLLSPLPSLSTHCETALLAPFVNWEAVAGIGSGIGSPGGSSIAVTAAPSTTTPSKK